MPSSPEADVIARSITFGKDHAWLRIRYTVRALKDVAYMGFVSRSSPGALIEARTKGWMPEPDMGFSYRKNWGMWFKVDPDFQGPHGWIDLRFNFTSGDGPLRIPQDLPSYSAEFGDWHKNAWLGPAFEIPDSVVSIGGCFAEGKLVSGWYFPDRVLEVLVDYGGIQVVVEEDVWLKLSPYAQHNIQRQVSDEVRVFTDWCTLPGRMTVVLVSATGRVNHEVAGWRPGLVIPLRESLIPAPGESERSPGWLVWILSRVVWGTGVDS